MLKSIEIGGKSYDMKSSAFTPIKYKIDYGTDMLADIGKINKINIAITKLPKDEQDGAWLEHIGEIVDIALRMAYVMITEYDPKFGPFDKWLQGIDKLFEDPSWTKEVMELAMNTFQGRS